MKSLVAPIAIACYTLFSGPLPVAQAAERATSDAALEAQLLSAMAYSKTLGKRLNEPGPAIRAYIDANYVTLKPDRRYDYVDYRILRRPATLLGQRLLVLEEEYLTRFIGCCVSPGIGAILRLEADSSQLRTFASENKCSLTEGKDVVEALRQLGVRVQEGQHLSISCRERDVGDGGSER